MTDEEFFMIVSPVQSNLVQSNDSNLSPLNTKLNSIWMPKKTIHSFVFIAGFLWLFVCGSFAYDSLDMQNIYFLV